MTTSARMRSSRRAFEYEIVPPRSLFATALLACFVISATVDGQPPVTALAVTPAGTAVVVASQAGVVVRSLGDLEKQETIPSTIVNPHDVAFSPDRTQLAVAGGSPAEEGYVELFEWPSCVRTAVLDGQHHDSILSLAWIDNNRLVTGGHDHVVIVWTIDDATPRLHFNGHSRSVTAVVPLTVTDSIISGASDHSIRMWRVQDGLPQRTFGQHTRGILDLCLRPSAQGLPVVASCSSDRTVRWWQPTIGRLVRFARLDSQPRAIAWLPDGTTVVAACTDGTVRWLDPVSTQTRHMVPAIDGVAHAICVRDDGTVIVGGSRGQVRHLQKHVATP